ncbi:hypothetical protein GCK72_011159 [Caenorhabditis remanei]|uniref:Uncharacterized protein n=1 Tax=Caenorhabditis remanei TaxID=31234 RepID=A0A6A5H714_CAERE|nr:hypothetical protein GCK72_011159 [Caenorhabditis remanei]KAF1762895.1 hypothetical protein GCK72_011159 [Caenorhabditis remanei]
MFSSTSDPFGSRCLIDHSPAQMFFFSDEDHEWRSVSEYFAIKWRVWVPPEANCCVYILGRPQEVFPLEVITVEAPEASQRMVLPRRFW